MEPLLLQKYVDDVLTVVPKQSLGSRWNNGGIEWQEAWEQEDVKNGKTRGKVTVECMIAMANSIKPYLKFTADYSDQGTPIPVLDTQIWIGPPSAKGKWFSDKDTEKETVPGIESGEGAHTLLYKFYKKPMSSPFTILQRSSVPEGIKVATASSELMRRLKRTSTLLSKGSL